MAGRLVRITADDAVLDGAPRIEGRRIGVLQLHEEVEGRGDDPRTVANRYDLDVAAVYRALAYYHEHPREMERVRERRQERVEAARSDALTRAELG